MMSIRIKRTPGEDHRRLVVGGLLIMAAASSLGAAYHWRALFDAATDRTPNELIRHLEKRLQGHTRLEALLLPPLHRVQRQLERRPPPVLPTLGKGQQQPGPSGSDAGPLTEWEVDTPQAIRDALLKAQAGTRIVVAPGLYPFDRTLRLGAAGSSAAPLVLAARQAGTVLFEFSHAEGILVDKPHWRFENLTITGVCSHHNHCEHAFHVVGKGAFTTLHNNRLVDFNAHVKVNGLRGDWPDHGQLIFNTFTNTEPRRTARPVVMLDLVGASHWNVNDNLVSHFVKAAGNKVSYGMFMKGGGEHGRFERNLVICTPQGISQPGARVGISFGGGSTNPAVCRADQCRAHEHKNGLAANNIVAHCNDAGLDVNGGVQIELVHNTLVNTAGISSRNHKSQTRAYGNLLDGSVKSRDGSELTSISSIAIHQIFSPGHAIRLSFDQPLENRLIESAADIESDFHGANRPGMSAPGAVHGTRQGTLSPSQQVR